MSFSFNLVLRFRDLLILDTMDDCLENKGNEEDGWVLINQIELSPKQAMELFEFLTAEEAILFLIATAEDRDVREACIMVINLLIKRAKRKKRNLLENEM